MIALPAPEALRRSVPLSDELAAQVAEQRQTVMSILEGRDDRLLAVVGPCSAHDRSSMIDYAVALAELAAVHAEDVYVVARVYAEKPRSRHGWPGLLLDPELDGSYRVDLGLESARRLAVEVLDAGMPVACEFLEPTLSGYHCDLVCWGSVGARTAESAPHRRLASDLDMPIGVKNRADGAVSSAVDAVAAAQYPQPVIGVDDFGRAAWRVSDGNPHTHLVLRGGSAGVNYDADSVRDAVEQLSQVQPNPAVVVDCSHGNSGKDHRRQPVAVEAVAEQVAAGRPGLVGVMLESFLHEGAQPLAAPLRHGVSVTDACMSLDQTAQLLKDLAQAVGERRGAAQVATRAATR